MPGPVLQVFPDITSMSPEKQSLGIDTASLHMGKLGFKSLSFPR